MAATNQLESEAQPASKLAGISVVIPAYNEEHGIGPVLSSLHVLLQQQARPYEIIVVDDGSQDNTFAVVRQQAGVTAVRHRTNMGYGAALKTGISRATYELVCITDADGTYPNERIFDLVAALEQNQSDMVVGARTGEHVAIPLVRRPAKWAIGQLANYIGGQNIPDINSGFRVFRRAAVTRFFGVLPSGFSFTTTITLSMLTSSYLVDYVSINYYARTGHSKIKPIRDTLNFVQLILRIGLYFVPLKIFLPVSVLLLLLAVAWGLFTALVLGQLADVSTMIIAMSGLQVAMFSLLAELINHRLPSSYRKEA